MVLGTMGLKMGVIFVAVCFNTHLLLAQNVATGPLKLPSQVSFLSQLLNVTVPKLHEVAVKFGFSNDITAQDVNIVQYTQTGNLTVNLTHSEGIEVDTDEKLVIIVHGFQSSGSEDWVQAMAQAYQAVGVNNTLAVDWNSGASQNYLSSAAATKKVGELVADWLLNHIYRNNTKKLANLHLVGHSLGAHLSGFIAKRVLAVTKTIRVGRISGLDAAGPLFEFPLRLPPHLRLHATDSENVDAYHTNKGYLGFSSALANQDFYINYGGPIQPGCDRGINFVEAFICSHSFAYEVFKEVIDSFDYLARQCQNEQLAKSNSCDNNVAVVMGENTNGTGLRGRFYANTKGNLD